MFEKGPVVMKKTKKMGLRTSIDSLKLSTQQGLWPSKELPVCSFSSKQAVYTELQLQQDHLEAKVLTLPGVGLAGRRHEPHVSPVCIQLLGLHSGHVALTRTMSEVVLVDIVCNFIDVECLYNSTGQAAQPEGIALRNETQSLHVALSRCKRQTPWRGTIKACFMKNQTV